MLQRVFEIDALQCPRCGSTMRLIAAIEDPTVARKILECLKLPARAPPARVRGGRHPRPGAGRRRRVLRSVTGLRLALAHRFRIVATRLAAKARCRTPPRSPQGPGSPASPLLSARITGTPIRPPLGRRAQLEIAPLRGFVQRSYSDLEPERSLNLLCSPQTGHISPAPGR